MSEQTTEAPPRIVADLAGSRGTGQRPTADGGSRILSLIRRHPWWFIAAVLMVVAEDRRIAHFAGFFAGATLLLIANYSHFILSDQSDTMIVATCLGAIDCQLCGRYRWAFFLWWLGSLGRPEVWPFLGLYSVWAWRSQPPLRK